jgi:hypothetical protein
MKYDQFRATGYLIGSGTVESGCKPARNGMWTARFKLRKPGRLGSAASGTPCVLNALHSRLPSDNLCVHTD